ncbi:glycosyltransferase family 4 protein [Microbacterium trichothecenolyticum]|uniref:Glycosyltransferase involved in cell wall biosynthesis n=1 Tax=Microbacterium trichothecenolyticum TaxID=69370 RepID=A0ABU0TVJ7_MICTR|nr:glycosyltransferase family 4 protein [Microbacterium trichothecenolyticum]MDQ1123674.1 glycosyltransferase involved in cell wall biosynthesis [Microbacterium trichothecenolyticum]
MRIVSVVAHVPYTGIPHAGGQYVLAHLRALRTLGHDVTVVAPDWRGNDEAARRLRAELDVDVVVCSPGLPRPWDEWLDTQQIRLFPVRPPRRFARAVLRSRPVREAVASGELIEAHWTEMGWISRALRTRRRDIRRVVVAHDVIVQTYERIFATTRRWSLAWVLGLWRNRAVVRDEGRLYRGMDAVVVFSEKDARFVRGLGVRADRAVVVRPPFGGDAGAAECAPPDGPPTVVFVGAFFRDVNAQAAQWLIDGIVPLVRARRPDVRFIMAGAGPTPAMVAAAAADPLLTVTGEVPSLEPSYASATAVVVPLLMGAGLKFKTVEALMRGIPVVSTTVGAEGLTGEGETGGLVVADEPDAIAAALLRILDDPQRAWREAQRSREWARSAFSLETYPARLEDALFARGERR